MINKDNTFDFSTTVVVESIKTQIVTVDLSQFNIDPVEYDSVEVVIEIPNGRPRRIKFPVADFLPRNF